KKKVATEPSDKDVIPAVVIVICNHYPHAPPAGVRQAAFRRYVGVGSISIVVEECADRIATLAEKMFDGASAYQENIQLAVIVVVQEGCAATEGFQNEVLLEVT